MSSPSYNIFEILAKKYSTPQAVQKFLRRMPYNRERRGETLRSALGVLKHKTAHCFEATFLAAALLEHHGYEPVVLSFESQDGLDHVIYIYQKKNSLGHWRWGSVARSRDEGLHGRPARYRTIKDLVWSYFDPYIDGSGRVTGYQIAHLDEMGVNWRTSQKNIWLAEKYLIDLKHNSLKSSHKRYRKILSLYKKKGPMTYHPHWW